eukprot:167399-Lingulodinium_polyedra.AAC.1
MVPANSVRRDRGYCYGMLYFPGNGLCHRLNSACRRKYIVFLPSFCQFSTYFYRPLPSLSKTAILLDVACMSAIA